MLSYALRTVTATVLLVACVASLLSFPSSCSALSPIAVSVASSASLIAAALPPQHIPTPSLVRQREESQLARAGLSISTLSDPAPAQWFTQRLDHFDRTNNHTWQQRYFVNNTNWNGTGPVLFLFGHEREMTADLVGGTWVLNWLAEHFGGLIVCLEHRFYGASWPGNDTSLAYMQRYLSTEQALEDAAVWTAHINKQYHVPARNKWIVLGRSYGGTLAALFRLKFPHIVTGAFATSGPLQAKADYFEYNEVIGTALGDKCSTALRQANDKVTQLLSNATGQAVLAKDFGFCAPLTSHLQHAMLIQSWSGDIDETVQYAMGNDTQNWCNTFLAAGGGDPYKALIELYFPQRSQCRAPLNYTQYVERAKRDAVDQTWTWQTCSAYGWYQTGNSTHQPFSRLLDVSFSLAFCRDVFGISPSEVYAAIAETNDRNGGYHIANTRVLYTNGQLDPWSRAAILPPNRGGPRDNVVYVIEGASHCTDFFPPSENDSPSLKRLRGIQLDVIDLWLKD